MPSPAESGGLPGWLERRCYATLECMKRTTKRGGSLLAAHVVWALTVIVPVGALLIALLFKPDPNCSGTFACASGEETSGLLAVIIVPPALTILIFGHCTIAAFRLWRLTRRARHESPDKPPTPLTGNISRSAAE